jgi:hypothetical protein
MGSAEALSYAGEKNDEYATLSWWYISQVADLCERLDKVQEGEGTLLDRCVVLAGSGLNESRDMDRLPLVMVGGGGGLLRGNQHVVFPEEAQPPLRDLYFTLLSRVFDTDVPSFGESVFSSQHAPMREILNA